MLPLAGLITALSALVTLVNWRTGMFAVMVVGVLQDPLRKLTPGVPSYYVLWAALVFGIVVLAAVMRKDIGTMRRIWLHDNSVRAAWQLFFFIVGLQALHALLRWGNPLVPVLGLVFYLGPVVALLVAIGYARSERAIKRFMLSYALIMAPAAMTVYLSPSYADQWSVLKEIGEFVGQKLIIYDVGTVLQSYPGIFRVGEIAAWHAATASSFLVILAVQNKSIAFRVASGVVIVLLIGAILLTGRRKMLMTLTLFVVVQWALLALYRKGSGRQTITLLIFGVIGSLGLTLLDDPGSESSLYMQRGISVFDSAAERFVSALSLLWSAVIRSDGIGLGVGVTSQGVHYVGGAAASAGGAGEAGMGKIVVELGLPGLFVTGYLVLMLARRLYKNLRVMARVNEKLLYYSVSFSAILVANAGTFAVAAQLYGDLFILIMLGFVAGMLFSVNLAGTQMDRQQRAMRAQQRPVPGRGNVYAPARN